MKTLSFFSLLCGLLLLTSCGQSELLDDSLVSPVSRALTNNGYTYFQNITSSGTNSIEGDIYCSKEADYSFTFVFQANAGASCQVRVGSTIMNVAANDLKKFTVKLPAGTTHCCVEINPLGVEQQAYARLTIDKINGSSAGSYEGYGDLTVMYSK